MNDAPTTELATRAQVSSGGVLASLAPQNIEEAFRLAKALSAAGDMVPKHFQGKPEMTMAAIIRGMELGLAPMQALSNIAVINGRASLWGDALPALMQRAGHHLDVEVTGEGDAMSATATLVRGDTGQTYTRSFSAADAKAAGLWGKAGPWQQYKARMLSMRARGWACRDGAADALMGLQVAEEVQDYPRDVTPKEPGGFAQKAMTARQPDPEPVAEPIPDATTDEITDAEVLPEDETQDPPAHWTEGIDYSDAFPGSTEWFDGEKAARAGMKLTMCPHAESGSKAADWMGGYFSALRSAG